MTMMKLIERDTSCPVRDCRFLDYQHVLINIVRFEQKACYSDNYYNWSNWKQFLVHSNRCNLRSKDVNFTLNIVATATV